MLQIYGLEVNIRAEVVVGFKVENYLTLGSISHVLHIFVVSLWIVLKQGQHMVKRCNGNPK